MRSACAVLLLTLSGCGYAPVVSNSLLGRNRILVEPFAEDTPVGLSADLTAAMALRLASQGITLCVSPANAEATLSGRIVSAATVRSPTSGVGSSVAAYDMRVRIEAWLHDKGDKELWHTAVDVAESFLPAALPTEITSPWDGQLAATEANRRRALRRLAETAAQQLSDRLAIANATTRPGA